MTPKINKTLTGTWRGEWSGEVHIANSQHEVVTALEKEIHDAQARISEACGEKIRISIYTAPEILKTAEGRSALAQSLRDAANKFCPPPKAPPAAYAPYTYNPGAFSKN